MAKIKGGGKLVKGIGIFERFVYKELDKLKVGIRHNVNQGLFVAIHEERRPGLLKASVR